MNTCQIIKYTHTQSVSLPFFFFNYHHLLSSPTGNFLSNLRSGLKLREAKYLKLVQAPTLGWSVANVPVHREKLGHQDSLCLLLPAQCFSYCSRVKSREQLGADKLHCSVKLTWVGCNSSFLHPAPKPIWLSTPIISQVQLGDIYL